MKKIVVISILSLISLSNSVLAKDSKLVFDIKQLEDSVIFVQSSVGHSFIDSTGRFEKLTRTQKYKILEDSILFYAKDAFNHSAGNWDWSEYHYYRVDTSLIYTGTDIHFEQEYTYHKMSSAFIWFGFLSIICSIFILYYQLKKNEGRYTTMASLLAFVFAILTRIYIADFRFTILFAIPILFSALANFAVGNRRLSMVFCLFSILFMALALTGAVLLLD